MASVNPRKDGYRKAVAVVRALVGPEGQGSEYHRGQAELVSMLFTDPDVMPDPNERYEMVLADTAV